jgi:predicted kinase
MDQEKPVLIAAVGLPRSGKTTWAKGASRRLGAPIVNPDAIRLAIHGLSFIADAEPFVWAVAKTMTRALFLAGHSVVVVDATNMSRRRRDEWKSSRWSLQFKVLDTDKAECVRRAEATDRADLIPVIERMDAEREPLGADEAVFPEAAP